MSLTQISLVDLQHSDRWRCLCGGERVWAHGIWPQVGEQPYCSFCHEPITSLYDGWIEFFDAAELGYPHTPENLLMAYAHTGCGPDRGYNIRLSQILMEGVDRDVSTSWHSHLLEKNWFCPTFQVELDQAYRCAEFLSPRPEPMRSVVESIPQRRPRASRNPRHISVTMRARVLERDGFRCRRCGSGPDVSPLEIDHVIPVAKGGTGDFDNLQTLCRPCNAGKSDCDPHAHDLECR